MAAQKLTVETHYGLEGLGEAILAALEGAGNDLTQLTPEDLAIVDEFHVRGRAATTEVARLAKIESADTVLDVGCGIGGPSRHLASEFGCRITGLDLTEEYCSVAAMLTEKTGLADRIDFRHGDALDMPFPDESFDVVWTQHVSMNIADRPGLYAEMRRVLKPGGRLAIYDVIAGGAGDIHFPVPWAREPSISFLLSGAEMRELLENTGFSVSAWRDATPPALEWFESVSATAVPGGVGSLGLGLLLGDDLPAMVANMRRNLEEGRVALVQTVLVREDG